MIFNLVNADETHIAQTAKLWQDGWHEAHSNIVPKELVALRSSISFVERLHSNVANTRIGLVSGDVVGLCITQEDEIYQMYVSPSARGIGLAQALMLDAENRLLNQGSQSAWLACAVGNVRAARFYEKVGWSNAGVQSVDLDTSQGAFPLKVWRFEKSFL